MLLTGIQRVSLLSLKEFRGEASTASFIKTAVGKLLEHCLQCWHLMLRALRWREIFIVVFREWSVMPSRHGVKALAPAYLSFTVTNATMLRGTS